MQQFANRMITAHTTANTQLAPTSSVRDSANASLPNVPLPAEAQKLATYATLTGPAFDSAYIADQI